MAVAAKRKNAKQVDPIAEVAFSRNTDINNLEIDDTWYGAFRSCDMSVCHDRLLEEFDIPGTAERLWFKVWTKKRDDALKIRCKKTGWPKSPADLDCDADWALQQLAVEHNTRKLWVTVEYE